VSRHQGDRILRELREHGFISFERRRRGLQVTNLWRPSPARITRESGAKERESGAKQQIDEQPIVEPPRESHAKERESHAKERDFHVDQNQKSDPIPQVWFSLCARVGWDRKTALEHLAKARQRSGDWANIVVDEDKVRSHLEWWASGEKKPRWMRRSGHGLATVLGNLGTNEPLVEAWRQKETKSIDNKQQRVVIDEEEVVDAPPF